MKKVKDEKTKDLFNFLLPALEKSLNNEKINMRKDRYTFDEISDENGIITELIKRSEDNRQYRKYRFLRFIRNCPDCPDSSDDQTAFEYAAAKANKMLEQTKKELENQFSDKQEFIKEKLKYFLYGKKKKDLIIKSNTISKWFNEAENIPSRKTLFLLSFAFELPLETTGEDYFTHESFFYRVFGQRSCSRNPDEICMIYCKKNGLDYTKALELYIKYLLKTPERKTAEIKKNEIKDSPSTRAIFDGEKVKLEGLPEKDFLNFLIDNAEFLVYQYSSINKIAIHLENSTPGFLEQIIDEYKTSFGETDEGLKYLEEIVDNYNRILTEEGFQTNLKKKIKKIGKGIFAQQSMFTDSLINNKKTMDYLLNKEGGNKEKIAQGIAKFRKYARKVLLFQEHYTPKVIYTDQYYNQQRKRWVLYLFLFYYWKKDVSKDKKYRETYFKSYISATNQVLNMNYFSPLLPYNDFDSLFLLCAQHPNPVDEFLLIIKKLHDGGEETAGFYKKKKKAKKVLHENTSF